MRVWCGSELSPVWKASQIRELFREHMICKHYKFKFYIPVNVVMWALAGGIEKLELLRAAKKMEGNDNQHNAQTQVLYLYICMHCDDACSTIQ